MKPRLVRSVKIVLILLLFVLGGIHFDPRLAYAVQKVKTPVLEFRELDSRASPPMLMKEVLVKHLLVCFTGANHCEQTRTKKEALKVIQKIRTGITTSTFAEQTMKYSDELAAKTSGGDIGWVRNDGQFVQRFTDAALALKKGEISKPVETEFGYHLIYAIDVRLPSWKKTELVLKDLKCAELGFDNGGNDVVVVLEFTKRGIELFSKITKRNIGKPLAIVLDDMAIVDTNGDSRITAADLYAPIVETQITNGRTLITNVKDIIQARDIVRRLHASACKPFTPATYKNPKKI